MARIILLVALCCACYSVSARHSITTTPLRDSLAVVYRSQIGVQELTGKNDGPEVEAYQKATGNRRGDAWCSSFVAWCFKKLGFRLRVTGAAASFFNGKAVVWQRSVHGTRRFYKLAACRGNTGSLYYASLNRIGHIFLIDDISGEYVITVEGNTNSALSREGGGVHSLRRRIRNIYSVSNPFMLKR